MAGLEFKTLDKWINDWKQAETEYLGNFRAAFDAWGEAKTNSSLPLREMQVKGWSAVNGYYTETVKARLVKIDGREYLDYRGSGRDQYIADCGFANASKEDKQLAMYYTPADWVLKVANKAEHKKKLVMAKVSKICGPKIGEVSDASDGSIFARGENGKVAHMWVIYAGGYNIQCLHQRILVKEAKWLEKDAIDGNSEAKASLLGEAEKKRELAKDNGLEKKIVKTADKEVSI